MNIIKKALFILLLLLPLTSYAQDRVNRPILPNEGESELIKEATGWYYSKSLGEWIGNQNVIYSNKIVETTDKSKLIYDSENNFISLQILKTSYNNDDYYILVVESMYNKFDIPLKNAKNVYLFIWHEFDNLKFSKAEKIKIQGMQMFINDDATNDEIRKYATTKILSNPNVVDTTNPYSNYYLYFKRTDKGEIRFSLPIEYGSFMQDKFEERYFETTEENFSKL